MKKMNLKKIMGMAALICLLTLMMGFTTMAANKYENISAVKGQVVNEDQDASINHYYRFKVNKPGLLQVTATATNGIYNTGLNISLCNAKGKVLSTTYVDGTTTIASFGLNRGTYMIKVNSPHVFALVNAFQNYADTGAKTVKKATNLPNGKVKKGVIGIGESAKKVDYFKITLKKARKIYLSFAASGSGAFTIKVTPAKSVKLKSGSVSYSVANGERNITLQTTTGQNLPKGTYYVRVYRTQKKSSVSGIYALQWQ